jgi:hypothetical protein
MARLTKVLQEAIDAIVQGAEVLAGQFCTAKYLEVAKSGQLLKRIALTSGSVVRGRSISEIAQNDDAQFQINRPATSFAFLRDESC